MTDSGHKVMFKKDNAYVVDSSRQIVAVGERQGNLYFVREAPESTRLVQTPQTTLQMWHERMGYLNEASLKLMIKEQLVTGMSVSKDAVLGTCRACIRGKQRQNPYPHRERRSREFLDIVHTDVWRPMKTQSIVGKRYLVTSTTCQAKNLTGKGSSICSPITGLSI